MVGDTGTYTIYGNNNLLQLVRDWYEQPSSNFGIVLFGNENQASSVKRFDSKENVAVNFRPQLTIWYKISTAVNQQLSANTMQLFPNPTQNSLTLKTESAVKNWKIYDALGKTYLLSYHQTEKQILFDTKQLVSGLYFIQIQTQNYLTTKTFIKL